MYIFLSVKGNDEKFSELYTKSINEMKNMKNPMVQKKIQVQDENQWKNDPLEATSIIIQYNRIQHENFTDELSKLKKKLKKSLPTSFSVSKSKRDKKYRRLSFEQLDEINKLYDKYNYKNSPCAYNTTCKDNLEKKEGKIIRDLCHDSLHVKHNGLLKDISDWWNFKISITNENILNTAVLEDQKNICCFILNQFFSSFFKLKKKEKIHEYTLSINGPLNIEFETNETYNFKK